MSSSPAADRCDEKCSRARLTMAFRRTFSALMSSARPPLPPTRPRGTVRTPCLWTLQRPLLRHRMSGQTAAARTEQP